MSCIGYAHILVGLILSLGIGGVAHAEATLVERIPQTVLQERMRARNDCLAWYDFGRVPEGLTFEPAPEQDALAVTAGSLEGQRATRIFHGRLKGEVLDIPKTGFTLCCWLKVNKLEQAGDAGVKLTGGDLPTLRSSGHVVENCHIHHFARWNRGAYQPGIEVEGVGVRMSHCLIHDAPHQAFLLSGNDHVTEYCEIHDVTHEAGDAGAWYMYGGSGAALSERGNVVRYNYWHHLPYNETFKDYHCICHMGVYIDNVNGGVTVYGNVFSRFDGSSGAVFFGGSDDIVENNVFYRCYTGINLQDRSWVYAKAYKGIDAFLARMKVNKPPWSVRYPRLTTIKPHTEDLTLIVRGNVVARNVGLDCGKFIYGNATTMRYARIERNWEKGDPGFREPDKGDFRLNPDSPVFTECLFEPLPLEKMGLYNDELRTSWPVHHPSGNYETINWE